MFTLSHLSAQADAMWGSSPHFQTQSKTASQHPWTSPLGAQEDMTDHGPHYSNAPYLSRCPNSI